MGIRKEIKLVIKEYATCTVGANEAINAIANIISRPKPEKLFPKQVDPAGTCQARQYSDQMFCKQCGIGWDMNDPEPPQCGRKSVTLEELTEATNSRPLKTNPFKGEGVLPEGQKPSTVFILLEDLPFPEITKEMFKKI